MGAQILNRMPYMVHPYVKITTMNQIWNAISKEELRQLRVRTRISQVFNSIGLLVCIRKVFIKVKYKNRSDMKRYYISNYYSISIAYSPWQPCQMPTWFCLFRFAAICCRYRLWARICRSSSLHSHHSTLRSICIFIALSIFGCVSPDLSAWYCSLFS